MMKRFILCVAMLLVFVSSTVSAENFSDVEINPNNTFDTIEIKGKSDIRNIVVKLFDVGADESSADSGSEVIAIDVVNVNENSEFKTELKFHKPIADGRHLIYLSGDGTTESKSYELWALSDATKESLMKKIYESTSTENLQTVLFAKEDIYNNGKLYDLADRLSFKNNVYKDIYANDISRILYPVKSADYDDMKKKFKIATAIAALNSDNFSNYTDDSLIITREFWEESDKAKSVENYYNEILSNVGRKNVLTNVRGAHPMTIKDFEAKLAQEVIYNSVYNKNNKYLGTEKTCETIKAIESLTNCDFSDFIGLTSQMQNKVITELSQVNCSDFLSMLDNLKRLSKPTDNIGNGGTGSSGSKGGSGISRSDNAVAPIKNVTPEIVYPFDDIIGMDWARDDILKMYNEGIVNGTGDNMFEPERPVTREEFTKMIVLALYNSEFDFTDEKSYQDVEIGQWYSSYIFFGKKNNLINGIGDNRFGIGEYISREDSVVILARALKAEKTKDEKYFSDFDNISDYAKDSAQALYEMGIIVGDDSGAFNPKKSLSRAEAAVMICRTITGGHTNE